MTKACDELAARMRGFLTRIDDERLASFLAEIDWNMPPRALSPHPLPCLVHLPRASAISGAAASPLAEFIADHALDFRWGQTYTTEDFGPTFLENYGWLEVFGTRGHFVSDRMAGGLLLLGPHLVYPDHHHQAEEIYIALTGGTDWRMGDRPFAPRGAGEVIHHPSDVSHAMRTGGEPLLAFYLWRGGPLAARSTIAERRPGA